MMQRKSFCSNFLVANLFTNILTFLYNLITFTQKGADVNWQNF
nr:MAG TPA: hypothetical protein [Caudoviricetes sp.]